MIMHVDKLNLDMFGCAAAVATDDHGIIVEANRKALSLFGYSEAEIVGRNVSMLMPTSIAKHHDAFMAHYRKHQDRRLIGLARVVNLLCRDGSQPAMTLRLGEYVEGKKLRFVGVFTEPTPEELDTSEDQDTSEDGLLSADGITCAPCPAYQPSPEFVSGLLDVRHGKSWKRRWIILDRNRKSFSVYSKKKKPEEINSLTVRALAAPSMVFNIVDSSVRDSSGITGIPGTFSVCEKGSKLRHFLCPSNSAAHAWVSELSVSTSH